MAETTDHEEYQSDLALWSGSVLLVMLAALLGVMFPPGIGAAAAASATLGGETVARTRSRREAARRRNLELVIADLQRRMGGYEAARDAAENTEKVDPLLGIVERAIADDEEQKMVFYSALLEWLLKEEPTRSQIRLLADAVQGLAYIELCHFVHTERGQQARAIIEPELPEQAVVNRAVAMGLRTGGISHRGNVTAVGKKFLQYVRAEDVPDIETLKRRQRSAR